MIPAAAWALRNPVLTVSVLACAGLALAAYVHKAQRDDARAELAQLQAQVAIDRAAAERAARDALQAAQEAARAERARLVEQARVAVDRAAAAEAQARAARAGWQRRYDQQRAADPDCAAWAAEPIRCSVAD